MVEHLPTKSEVFSSNPSTTKKKKEEKKREEKRKKRKERKEGRKKVVDSMHKQTRNFTKQIKIIIRGKYKR
jgi:hypothetical protein